VAARLQHERGSASSSARDHYAAYWTSAYLRIHLTLFIVRTKEWPAFSLRHRLHEHQSGSLPPQQGDTVTYPMRPFLDKVSRFVRIWKRCFSRAARRDLFIGGLNLRSRKRMSLASCLTVTTPLRPIVTTIPTNAIRLRFLYANFSTEWNTPIRSRRAP